MNGSLAIAGQTLTLNGGVTGLGVALPGMAILGIVGEDSMEMDLPWLEAATRRELAGCRVLAHDGTVLFTPDGVGSYGALWTRDFAYMVENAGDLLEPGEVRAAILYLLRGQRADGCIPDRVQADGRPVYSAGAADAPLGEPPTDNGQFMVKLVYDYVCLSGDLEFASAQLEALRRGLEYIPRSVRGLVTIAPGERRSPYGFTDTVAKTGDLLFSSLLDWEACRKMAALCERCGTDGSTYADRAERIVGALEILWDEGAGAYRAASGDCRQVDVWGNAYAVYLGLVRGPRRERILSTLRERYADYVYRGQVRHLMRGEYWEKLLIPIALETYQNGAYWATASGWVIVALAEIDSPLAHQMAQDLLADLQEEGFYECINIGYRKLEHYVASAVNPLGGLRCAAELWSKPDHQ
jgi:hypothetical protein